MKIKGKAKQARYLARPGSPISDKQAALIGAALEEIDRDGLRKTPGELLERAKPGSSPIHPLFDWDDTSAGEKYRITQAREFIASVLVISVETKERSRAFYSVTVETPEEAGRSYEPRERVLVSDDAMVEVGWGLFLRLRAAAKEAQSLGLHSRSSFWRQACQFALSSEPEEKPPQKAKKESAAAL